MRITVYAILFLTILFTLYSTTTASTTSTTEAKETTQTINNCDQPKSKFNVIVLSVLLGGLGVDRFYTGFIALGIIKLLLSIGSCGKKK
jgi:hypothetical protein